MRKKIAVTIPSLALGGAERSLVRLVNCLNDDGFDITIILFASETGPCSVDLCPDIRVLLMGGIQSSNPFLWFRLEKVLKEIEPDLVVGWSTYANLVSILVNKVFGRRKVLVSERNYLPKLLGPENESSYLRRILTSYGIKVLYARADCVTANSEDSLRFMKSYIGKRPTYFYLPNMIDVRKSLEMSKEAPPDIPVWVEGPRLLALGRMDHQKGFDVLVRAMAIVRKVKRWSLGFVGEGSQRRVLEKQVQDLKMADCIFFLGEKIDPFPYYGWADIVIIPSRFEGFPNVLLEAMACRKAVIVTNCLTGPKEITLQGKFGRLIPVENEEALAAEILYLGENKTIRETLGQQASVHIASKYDTSVIGFQIKALFKNLAS